MTGLEGKGHRGGKQPAPFLGHRAEPLSGILDYQVGVRRLINYEVQAQRSGPRGSVPGARSLGPAQQPSHSVLMLPTFTLFRLWFSSFR